MLRAVREFFPTSLAKISVTGDDLQAAQVGLENLVYLVGQYCPRTQAILLIHSEEQNRMMQQTSWLIESFYSAFKQEMDLMMTLT